MKSIKAAAKAAAAETKAAAAETKAATKATPTDATDAPTATLLASIEAHAGCADFRAAVREILAAAEVAANAAAANG